MKRGARWGSGAVWVASSYSPGGGAELSQEDYERGVRPEPDEGANLVRVDPRTNRVEAKIPIEAEAIEGGASGVAMGEGSAVWVTSVNGKLLRVDPETDEVVARLGLGDRALDDDSAEEVEASGGAVWVRATLDYNSPGWTQHLVRVDPQSNRVVGSVGVEDASGLALGPAGAVWFTTGSVETGEGALVRVLPQAHVGAMTRHARARPPSAGMAGSGPWGVSGTGREPERRSGRIVATKRPRRAGGLGQKRHRRSARPRAA